MALFKDFGKAAKDLLSKNYDDKLKAEVSNKAGDVSFDGEWLSKGNSKVESEFKLPNNVSVNVECLSDSKITGTFKLKDVFQGAVFKTKASTANKIFFGLEYTQEWGTVTGDADYDVVKGVAAINASTLLKHKKFLVGGSVQLKQGTEISKFDIGLGYSEPKKYEVTAQLSEEPNNAPPQLLVQYIHYADNLWTYAARVNNTLDSSPKTTVDLGGTYQHSADTKIGFKINNTGVLGLYLVAKADPNVTLTQSIQVDVNDRSAPHKFGFGVKFAK